jgi:hypothetical protein
MLKIREVFTKVINEEIKLQRRWNDAWTDLSLEGACRVLTGRPMDRDFTSFSVPNIRIKPMVITVYKFAVEENKRAALCAELMQAMVKYGATVERSAYEE